MRAASPRRRSNCLPAAWTTKQCLVTTKHAQLENKDALRRRLDEAAKLINPSLLALSPQCGFASVVEGNLITEAGQRAKLRLIVETAREYWGSV